jgi:sarcosine oxidase, subunit beta
LTAHYDVAVIGAGLVGCATAFQLARRGQRVVVIDQAEMNRGASGRNAGSLHFQIELRVVETLERDPQRVAQLIPVNLQAIEDWKRLPKELGADLELAQHGGLMVAETDTEREVLQRKVSLETRAGLPVRLVEGAELRRIAPYLSSRIRCASYCPVEGHANPRLVTPAYAAAARRLGAEFRQGLQVSALEPHEGEWRIRAHHPSKDPPHSQAPVVADAAAVLVTAGAWSRELLAPLGVQIPLAAAALTLNVTNRAAPLIEHLVQHIGRRLSIKQVKAGNILIGGGWPAAWAEGSDLGLDPEPHLLEASIIGNTAVALHTIPAIAQLQLIRTWSGIASEAPDHLPVLGAIGALPGVFIAAGGSSFTLGPTYARLISELICDGAASLPTDLYRPDRFARH